MTAAVTFALVWICVPWCCRNGILTDTSYRISNRVPYYRINYNNHSGQNLGYINEHVLVEYYYYSYHGTTAPSESGPLHYQGCTITLTHTTLSRTPVGWWSAWRTEPYLTTQWKYSTVNIELLLTQPYTRICKKIRVAHCSQNSFWTVG